MYLGEMCEIAPNEALFAAPRPSLYGRIDGGGFIISGRPGTVANDTTPMPGFRRCSIHRRGADSILVVPVPDVFVLSENRS